MVHAHPPSARGEWLDGPALLRPAAGALSVLLQRIARELGSDQRKLIAAAFALRYGAAAAAAIRPFWFAGYVPNVALENIALKFGANARLERVTLRARGLAPVQRASFRSRAWLIAQLRRALCAQAEPVVEALSRWSRLNPTALWGLVTSAWGQELVRVGASAGDSERALETVTRFMHSHHPAFRRAPRFYVMADAGRSQICQIRGSCCLYYRTPAREHCVSCPLIDERERERRYRALASSVVAEQA